ncbi:type I secretion system permease/ATPase [Bradyrhizobium sp. AUGA SZCCT0240]|uniref:type I secretion system permease/ATPase n=1 Tax=unclassified Bradyrhizobium TaxID=2631580 RepID=UPI001BADC509|nr:MULTISPECIES: type I secretion system permease/ATPase [unclassified Bradyrhizobium]MBR1199615.1 type I secretion system permease/ATPase [Bradyrhizobium sp. AUGA SZCCT0158]MBR1243586.1 type I secretion system permease/ATPase [Bradyrhizobium sp. AUGA SZCCT0274]MBR1256247.1 type I secretion system permease/ATPase [Bradyrhizobium sp. AUGA SZCCT0240]
MTTSRQQPTDAARGELDKALAHCRSAFFAIAGFSAILNILALTGSLFMMEVYDRVLPSRSVPTLLGLLALVLILYVFQGFMDALRGRLLVRIGLRLDQEMSDRVYATVMRLPIQAPKRGESIQPLRDLDTIRGYLSGPGPTAFFDLPWVPLYLAICFAFHFWIGVTVLAGALVLVSLTLLSELLAKKSALDANRIGNQRARLAETSRRNAEALTALGMTGWISRRWQSLNRKFLSGQVDSSDLAAGLGAMGRAFRMMLQSGVLAVGAYLVINQQATAGVIIASSILSARALAPVDLAISHWRSFVGARQARQRLHKLLMLLPELRTPTSLPKPQRGLSVENISAAPPDVQRAVVHEVTFALKAGNGLGVIGPSASGKSSLARVLVGLWAPARGAVRLDGATLDQWVPDELGRHIGYLPQDVELIEGTVAENISRFDPDASSEAIIAAAKAAGVNELVLSLPQGYDTEIGEQGSALSAGQQQRVALARALYGDPFLVVLDEPNSNLDAEGDEALTQAILGVRARGAIVIVVAHRPSALSGVDHVLAMSGGRQQAFGPKDEVLAKVLRRDGPVSAPKVVQAVQG